MLGAQGHDLPVVVELPAEHLTGCIAVLELCVSSAKLLSP